MAGSGSEEDKKKGFNKLFLGNIKSRAGKETTNWLNDLTDEDGSIEDMVEQAAQMQSTATALPAQFSHPSIAQTQVKWVDRLFDLFQQYEVEYNRAVQSPQLRVETERAVITQDLISKMQGSDHHHYTGRLHTRLWTMVIRGNLSHIEGYVIPSDHYIGFERNVESYSKFFEFVPLYDGELKWGFEKGSINSEQLPSVAKRIFGQLVRVAKGEAQENERFGHSNPAHNQQAQRNTGDFPAQPPQSGEAPDYLLKHGGVFEDGPELEGAEAKSASGDLDGQAPEPQQNSARSGRAGRTSARMSVPVNPQTQAGQPESNEDETAQSQPAGPPETQQEAAHQPMRQQMSQQTNTQAGSQLDPAQVSLAQAFDILAHALNNELDQLSKAGARAFETHDFAKVELLMKRTAKLKSMKDQMAATINEWKRLLQNPE